MLKQQVTRTENRKFTLAWYYLDEDENGNGDKWKFLNNSKINLNWNILCSSFTHTLEKYSSPILLHWQAKPKGYRRFGLYDINNDEYYSRDYDQVVFNGEFPIELIQANDNAIKESPVAVILLNGVISVEEDYLIISKV